MAQFVGQATALTLSSTDMSQATITSSWEDVRTAIAYALVANFPTGSSPTGTFILQLSNDQAVIVDYTGSDHAITATGNWAWNVGNVGYQYVRLKYTRTSGSGTLSATICKKVGD